LSPPPVNASAGIHPDDSVVICGNRLGLTQLAASCLTQDEAAEWQLESETKCGETWESVLPLSGLRVVDAPQKVTIEAHATTLVITGSLKARRYIAGILIDLSLSAYRETPRSHQDLNDSAHDSFIASGQADILLELASPEFQ
jgi:hypothetical protein